MRFDRSENAFGARQIALIGIMAATIECGKLALSFLPNIEIVTLLCALYGYIFGFSGVIAAVVFVCIEPLIYGISSWVVTYFIFWPIVAFIFMMLARRGVKHRMIFVLVATLLSVVFGMLCSVIDTAFFLGINEHYPKNLLLYYIRGLGFDIVHTVSNFAVFITLFPFLLDKFDKIKKTMSL